MHTDKAQVRVAHPPLFCCQPSESLGFQPVIEFIDPVIAAGALLSHPEAVAADAPVVKFYETLKSAGQKPEVHIFSQSADFISIRPEGTRQIATREARFKYSVYGIAPVRRSFLARARAQS